MVDAKVVTKVAMTVALMVDSTVPHSAAWLVVSMVVRLVA